MGKSRRRVLAWGCGLAAVLHGGAVHAQTGYSQMAPGATPSFRSPGSYQRVTGTNNPALNYFGGQRAIHYVPSGRGSIPAPKAVRTAAYAKPFNGLPQSASISPYLALDQRETEGGVPNYYMYVKPQLDQYSTNQALQMQNRRLQQQLRRATTADVLPPGTSGGMPTTGQSLQFMNHGGYYPEPTR